MPIVLTKAAELEILTPLAYNFVLTSDNEESLSNRMYGIQAWELR
jgi:hypothetical protein